MAPRRSPTLAQAAVARETSLTSRMTRWTGTAGVLFFVALAGAILGLPNPPGTDASATRIVTFYRHHRDAVLVNAYVTEVAVIVGLAFFWYLREYVCTVPENRRLATLGFIGGVLLAVSGGLSAGFNQVVFDGVKHLDPGSMQLLNTLGQDQTNYLGGIGVTVLLGATGIAVIRSGVLPRWLGWLGMVFAVGSLVISFIGLAGIGLWSLITGIVLIIRAGHLTTTPRVSGPPLERAVGIPPLAGP